MTGYVLNPYIVSPGDTLLEDLYWPIQNPSYLSVIPNVVVYGTETAAGANLARNNIAADAAPGTRILYVDRLGDSVTDGGTPANHGTLRWCLNQHNTAASGGTTIVFKISGTIESSGFAAGTIFSTSDTTKNLVISRGRLTIAGQTAPSPGIQIKGMGFNIRASDILIQHLRIRPGAGPADGVEMTSTTERVIIDHCSIQYAWDEAAAFFNTVRNSTFVSCLLSDAIGLSGTYRATETVIAVNGQTYNTTDSNSTERCGLHRCYIAAAGTGMPNFYGTSGIYTNNVFNSWGYSGANVGATVFYIGQAGNTLEPANGSKLTLANNLYSLGTLSSLTPSGFAVVGANGNSINLDWEDLPDNPNVNAQIKPPVQVLKNLTAPKRSYDLWISGCRFEDGLGRLVPGFSENDASFGDNQWQFTDSSTTEYAAGSINEAVTLPNGQVMQVASKLRNSIERTVGCRPLENRDYVDTQSLDYFRGAVSARHHLISGSTQSSFISYWNTYYVRSPWPSLTNNSTSWSNDPIPASAPNEIMPSGYTRLEEWLHRRSAEVEPLTITRIPSPANFRVTSSADLSVSLDWDDVPDETDIIAPSIPVIQSAIAVSSSRIDLTWAASTDNQSGVRGYYVRRSLDNQNWTELPSLITPTETNSGGGSSIIFNGDFSTGNFTQWKTPSEPDVRFFQIPAYGRPIQYGNQNSNHVGNGELLSLVAATARTVNGVFYPQGPTRGSSQYSARFMVKNSANGVEPDDCDPSGGTVCTRRRSQLQGELITGQTGWNSMPYGSERWISASFYTPSHWQNAGSGFGRAPDFGLKPQGVTPLPGIFAFELEGPNNTWQITHRYNGVLNSNSYDDMPWWQRMTYDVASPGLPGEPDPASLNWYDTTDFPNVAASRAALSTVTYDGWTDWIVHVKFDNRTVANGGTGFLDVYKRDGDGPWVKVLHIVPKTTTRGGRTFAHGIGYNHPDKSHGSNIGIYCDKNVAWSAPTNLEAYMANYKIGNESATFEQMSPDGSGNSLEIIFSDTNLSPGTLYYYQVKAIDNSNNQSGWSASVSATTLQTVQPVTNGMILHLDAGNSNSYSGSGTTWRDLSASSANFTLINGPAFSAPRSIRFDGSNDYATSSSTAIQIQDFAAPAGDRTIEIWFKVTGPVGTRDPSLGTFYGYTACLFGDQLFSNGVLRLQDNVEVNTDGSGNFYRAVWTWDDSQTAGAFTNTVLKVGEWNQLVVLLTQFTASYYINGVLDKEFFTSQDLSVAGIPQQPTWSLARSNRGGFSNNTIITNLHLKCDVSIVRQYNRILSPAEILQNYNADSNKFLIDVDKWQEATPNYLSPVKGLAGYAFEGWQEAGLYNNINFYRVTNLNKSGSGSLKAGVEGTWTGLRIIVFEVSGLIDMSTANPQPFDDRTDTINCNKPNLIIAGQTAPAGGIWIKGKIAIAASRVILWHVGVLRNMLTSGTTDPAAYGDTITIFGPTGTIVENIALVNVLAYYGQDETIDAFLRNANVSIVNSMISFPIRNPNHHLDEGSQTTAVHDYGIIFGDVDRSQVSRSIISNAIGRMPLSRSMNTLVDNNLIYNWGLNATQIYKGTSTPKYAYIQSNLYVVGPFRSVYNGYQQGIDLQSVNSTDYLTAFVNGNRSLHTSYSDELQSNFVIKTGTATNSIIVVDTIPTGTGAYYPQGYNTKSIGTGSTDRQNFAKLVMNTAGPRPLDRISIQNNLINQVQNGINNPPSGTWVGIDNPEAVGSPGYPSFTPVTRTFTIGTGPGQLPIGNELAAGSYINKSFDFLNYYTDLVTPSYAGTILDTTKPTAPTNFSISSIQTNQLTLTWTAATDNVAVVGYRLERSTDNVNWSNTVYSGTQTTFTDSGLTPNTRYYYRLRAFDQAGNNGDWVSTSATTASAIKTNSILFLQAGDNLSYNGSGTVWNDLSAANNDGNLVNAPVFFNAGAASYFRFNGTNQGVTTTVQYNDPQVFTLSVWFRTSVASGRKIIGFESPQTGTTSTAWDRQIYINTTGKVVFGVYDEVAAATRLLTSLLSYNDGQWHNAVVTFNGNNASGTNMNLYIDGVLIVSGSSVRKAETNNGWWRIGFFQTSGWPGALTGGGYWTGDLGMVAVYDVELNAATVKNYYDEVKNTYVQVVDTTPPSVPTGVSASATSSSSITVSWTQSTDNESGVASYSLRRSTDQTNWTVVNGITSLSYVQTGLNANTTYFFQVQARDNAGNVSAWSASTSATTNSSTAVSWPRFATWLPSRLSFNTTSAQYDRFAAARFTVFQHWDEVDNQAIQTFINEVKARNPNNKLYIYVNQMEKTPDQYTWPVATYVDANNYWARSSWPNGTISVGGFGQRINELATRTVAGKTWYEWYIDYLLDTKGRKNIIGLSGISYDNTALRLDASYDWNEDGVTESATSLATVQRATEMTVARQNYIKSKKPEWDCATWNGIGIIPYRNYQDNQDYVPYYKTISSGDFAKGPKLYESAVGLWYSNFGYYIYTTNNAPPSWNGFTAWPNGFDQPSVSISSAPAVGTLVKSGFGFWNKNLGQTASGTNGGFLDGLKLVHQGDLCPGAKDQIAIGGHAPGPSMLSNQQANINGQLPRYWRWFVGMISVLTDFSYTWDDYAVGNYSDTFLVDESRINWGNAVDAPALDRSVNGEVGGFYKREFENVLWYANPPTNTIQSITLPSAGAGKAWYRFNAANFSNQDPVVNNGQLQSGAYLLKPFDAIMFVREQAAVVDVGSNSILYLRAGNTTSYNGSGTVWNDLSTVDNDGNLQATPTFFSNGAASYFRFNGTNQFVSTTDQFNDPQVLSISVWFKTGTTNGKKIIGFENSQVSAGGSYDRHIYMEADGRLSFGVWTGTERIITSTNTYNNNRWYNVVATYDGNNAAGTNMRLYVDGVQVASGSSVSAAQPYSGWWKIAGISLSGWGSSTNGYWAGDIGTAIVYNVQLTAETVLQYYNLLKDVYVNIIDTTPPTVPTGVSASATSSSSITVSWTASTDTGSGVASYSVQRSTTSNTGPWTTVGTGITSTSFTNTGLTASTTYYYQVQARDNAGNVSAWSASTSATTQAAVVTSRNYPRIGIYWIGNYSPLGGQLYQYESSWAFTYLPKMDTVVINGWPEVHTARTSAVYRHHEQIATQIKNRSQQGVKIFMYTDSEAVYKDGSATSFARMRAHFRDQELLGRYLYGYNADGTRANSYYDPTNLWATNMTDNSTSVNPGQFLDTSGRSAQQYIADHSQGWIYNGVDGNISSPSIDGIFIDNFSTVVRNNLDYNRNGIPDSNETNTTVVTRLKDGLKSHVTRLRTGSPSKLVVVNLAEWVNDNFQGYENIVDGGVVEWIIGTSFSYETFGDNGTGSGLRNILQKIQNSMRVGADPKMVVLHNTSCTDIRENPPYSNPLYFRDMRYGLAATLVLTDCAFTYAESVGASTTTFQWFPEYDFNLGNPIDSIQTAPRQNGIWRRDFQNGIVLWCPRGILGTITLNGTFYVLRGNMTSLPNSSGVSTTIANSTVLGTSVSGGLTPGQALTSVNFANKRPLPFNTNPETGAITYWTVAGNLSSDTSARLCSGARDGLILSRTQT